MKSKIDIALLKKNGIAVGIFMILAYMYVLTNGAFMYDATGVYRGDANFLVGSDKWAGGLYWWMDLGVNMPWFAGVWAAVLMIAVVYCICDIWDIKTVWGIALIAGLCVTNSSIATESLYTGQNFYIIIPLFEAVFAAWILRRSDFYTWLKVLLAVVLVALSAGTYGAMVSMMPAVLLVAVILDILNGTSAKENWRNTIQYICVFVGGMALYYVILKALLYVQGGEIQSYMGESAISNIGVVKSMLEFIPTAYRNIIIYYMGASYFLPVLLNKILTWIMILGCLESALLLWLYRKKIQDKLWNIILMTIAVGISPAVLNLIDIMSLGNVHHLMIFTYCIPILAFVRVNELIFEQISKHKARYTVYISRAVFIVYIYYSIVLCNALSIYFQQMYIETISIGTRILDRIETCEGFDGTETIILVGGFRYDEYWHPLDKPQPAMILRASLGQANINNGVNYASLVRRFLNNVLDSNLEMVPYNTCDSCIQEENLSVEEIEILLGMLDFPVAGSVRKIGDRIFVKMAEE